VSASERFSSFARKRVGDGGAKPPSSTPPLPAILPHRPTELLSAADVADALQAAVREAKDGDMRGAEVVRRYWRDQRGLVVLDIAPPRTAQEIADAQSRVMAITFAGGLTTREGRDVSTMIEYRRRALHTLEQQRQLDELMEMARKPGPDKTGKP
jgi:hypothetical protein